MIEHATLQTAVLQSNPGARALLSDLKDLDRHDERIAELEHEVREAPDTYSRIAAKRELQHLRLGAREREEQRAIIKRAIRRLRV
jgi:hypothetical protein